MKTRGLGNHGREFEILFEAEFYFENGSKNVQRGANSTEDM